MKWVYARGTSLLPAGVAAMVFSGFLWQWFVALPDDPQQPQAPAAIELTAADTKYLEDLATAQDALTVLTNAQGDGVSAAHAGDIRAAVEGIEAALLAAENIATPDAALLEETHRSLQLVSFFVAALMSDADLEAFCEPPTAPTPLGDMIRVAVHRLYRESYAAGRPYAALDEPTMREVCLAVRDSESVLGRFVALVFLSSPQWESLDAAALDDVVVSLNELASSFPSNRVTDDVMHQLVRTCAGRAFEHPDAVKLLLTQVPWNAEVRTIIASDPLLQDVQDLLVEYDANRRDGALIAHEAVVNRLQSLSKESPDATTREWCVRALASTNSLKDADTSPAIASIRQALATIADAPLVPSAEIPGEQLRAAFTLFANDVDTGALDAAETYIPMLQDAIETAYAPDLNFFEAIPRKLLYYAMARVLDGNYEKARTMLSQLQARYPGSYFARECEGHLNHIAQLLQPRP